MKQRPVVIYLHDAGEDLEGSGLRLRQLAELGLAAVGVECNQTNQALFDTQFGAALDYVRRQPWADMNALAWFGYGAGVRGMLGFASKYPGRRPQLLICLAGACTSDFASENISPRGEVPTWRVLVVHGREDKIFPAQNSEALADLLRRRKAQVDLCLLNGQTHDLKPEKDLVWRVIGEYARGHIGLSGNPSVRPEGSYWYCWVPMLAMALLLVRVTWRRVRAGDLAVYKPASGLAKVLFAIASGVAAVALGEAVLQVALPRCAVTGPAKALARTLLLVPEWREDFNSLAGDESWSGKRLGELIEHVELSNLMRRQFYTELDQATYRRFVLSPRIRRSGSEEWSWRRRLWEACYPRVRNEQRPAAGATTIVRFLRERVAIRAEADTGGPGVATSWKLGAADELGFEEIYVAALRSVGIAARMGEQGKTELWTGVEWVAAPRPFVETGFRFCHL